MRLALTCTAVFLLGACAVGGARSSGTGITRLDGSTIDEAVLTERIEALTRAANVQGLTVTIFNDAEKVYKPGGGLIASSDGGKLATRA